MPPNKRQRAGPASDDEDSDSQGNSMSCSDSLLSDDASSASGNEGAAPSSNGCGYRVIDSSMLKKVQNEAVDTVTAIMGCRVSVAKTLLMSFRWDKEKLMNVLADKGPEAVYKQAGVAEEGTAPPGQSLPEPFTCLTCFEEVPLSQCTTMDCGHTFCNACWRQHCLVQIAEGKSCVLSCMAYQCGKLCDEDKVGPLVRADPEAAARFKTARLQSYMEANSRVKFCPSTPWCGHAIEVDEDPYVEPDCPCGVSFCFKCGSMPHSPCTCALWRAWDDKICGDSETRNWMLANTKPCPKCGNYVEKNGGCNLVMCKCRQPFCWLCGQATGLAHTWERIEGHECGRYRDEMDERVNEAQRNHKRYMHYFTRYKAHADSHTKEAAKRSEYLSRMEDCLQGGVEARDYGWLLQALDQLNVARRVLSNSYAFAYLFFGNDLFREDFSPEANAANQGIFEDCQQQLEAEVERLSGLLAAALELLEGSNNRLAVLNSSASIATRIVKLYDLIENDLYGKLQSAPGQIAMYKEVRRA